MLRASRLTQGASSIHLIINQNALVYDVVLVLDAMEGVDPVAWQLPAAVTRTDSFTFCEQCGAVLSFLLERTWSEEDIRATWSDLLA